LGMPRGSPWPHPPLVRHDQTGVPAADKSGALLPRPPVRFRRVEYRRRSDRQGYRRCAAAVGERRELAIRRLKGLPPAPAAGESFLLTDSAPP
jgi:hypothetical protein